MIIEALALGLSTGTYCTMYCVPVLLPFLFNAEKIGFARNAGLTGLFLGGRFAMYFSLGIILSSAGVLAGEFFDPVLSRKISWFAYIVCGSSLLLNSTCRHKCRLKKISNDYLSALVCGLSVGLHICPPLWTAMFRTISGGFANRFYMLFFYLGSIPFFLPFLGIPFAAKRIPVLKKIARITQILLGGYFILMEGLIPLLSK